MLALINTPGLARLNVRFEQESFRLHVSLGTSVLFDEPLNSQGRERLAEVLAGYVAKLDVNPLTDHRSACLYASLAMAIHRDTKTNRQVGSHCTAEEVLKQYKLWLGTRSANYAFAPILRLMV